MSHWDPRRASVVLGLFMASACRSSDSPCACINAYQAIATGFNVATHKNPADTAARASFTINGSGTSFVFTYALDVPPHGTVNSIQLLKGATVEGTLCSAAPCPANQIIKGVTDTTLFRAMQNFQLRVRVYTDSDPAGAADGAVFPEPGNFGY
ncbi:MAG TPA: hypothetical protein VLV16_07120 [Gemmatimonadales bacterium]|nr:hypothetical protein [Gemmatimonadales bacterium]